MSTSSRSLPAAAASTGRAPAATNLKARWQGVSFLFEQPLAERLAAHTDKTAKRKCARRAGFRLYVLGARELLERKRRKQYAVTDPLWLTMTSTTVSTIADPTLVALQTEPLELQPLERFVFVADWHPALLVDRREVPAAAPTSGS